MEAMKDIVDAELSEERNKQQVHENIIDGFSEAERKTNEHSSKSANLR